ncbi:hypothetical protein CRE_14506 [Caenorhabditis remanei]|uniref:Serpentine Receptor, class Z n=1 Tax=Caenorhabditis remanei TaxID=31234 RepID=E3M994_CAERE|nr:hypothetical protein CRE_14506 [Caenorhabditis remanei]
MFHSKIETHIMNPSNCTNHFNISNDIHLLYINAGGIGLVVIVPVLFIVSGIFSILSFPIYCVIRNKNLAKERESPIYPIVDHFFLYSCLKFGCIAIPFIFWILDSAGPQDLLFFFTVVFVYMSMVTLSPIFNILLIILTFQRFVLYYVENSEKYVSFKISRWRLFFGAMYITSTLFNCGIRVAKLVSFIKNGSLVTSISDNEIIDFIDDTFMNVVFALEVLVVISAALYIPMFHSIQKLAYLPSVSQYQPQKYVKYQALLISVMKSFMFLFAFFGAGSFPELKGESAFIFLSFSTFFTTPMVIQMTYIFCNKRNVKIMLSYVSVENVVDKLKSMFQRRNNVHPVA